MNELLCTLYFLLACFYFTQQQNTSVNYVVNGDFSLPSIRANTEQANAVGNWTGQLFLLVRANFFSGVLGQYINLKANSTFGGYIEQSVTLPHGGSYLLSYKQKPYNSTGGTEVMKVYWNSFQLATNSANSLQQFNIEGNAGANILKFQANSNSQGSGMFIDVISVTQPIYTPSNNTNTNSSNNTNSSPSISNTTQQNNQTNNITNNTNITN